MFLTNFASFFQFTYCLSRLQCVYLSITNYSYSPFCINLLKKENHILGPWQDNKKDKPLRLVEMVLESTFICVDNSDFMRNGDFLPTRLAAQHDAVNVVCNYKTRGNPENNVGLLTMAGKRVEVKEKICIWLQCEQKNINPKDNPKMVKVSTPKTTPKWSIFTPLKG